MMRPTINEESDCLRKKNLPRRREKVLTKLNPSLASLGKEEFPQSGKQLFGDGFESRLKDRSETARTVAVAHFFSEVCFPGRARPPSRQFYAEPAQTIFPKVPENQVYIHPVPYSSVPTPTISDSRKPGKGKGQLLIKPVLKAKPVPPPGMYLNPIKINCPIAGRLKHFLPNREQITQDPWIRQVVGDPSPGFSTKANDRKCRESTSNRERSAKTGDQGSYSLGVTSQSRKRVFEHAFSSTKERGRTAPGSKFKTSISNDSLQALQNGGEPYVEGPVEKRELFSQGRPKRCLHDCLHLAQTQKYLRFLWKDNLWEFACLPFGLASAPRAFTKLLKPVVSVLRQMGLRIIIYLDDILIMSQSHDPTLTHAATALNLLEGL